MLIEIDRLKQKSARILSSAIARGFQLQKNIHAYVTRSPHHSVQPDSEIKALSAHSPIIVDSPNYKKSAEYVEGEVIDSDPDSGCDVSADCEQPQSQHHDLHNGRLRDFTKCLDRGLIEKELRGLESYAEFRRAIEHFGEICNFEDWKSDDRPDSCDYDASQLKRKIIEVEKVRCSRDPEQMLHLIRSQLSRFLGDMDSETLFHPFLSGTKKLIEEYTNSICGLIRDFTKLSVGRCIKSTRLQIAEHLEETRLSFGRTALMCSGGGTLGMRHIGTIKCLFETGSLPHIISGSSAGAIVCAVLCSQQDDQLQRILENFCHGDLKVFVGDHEEPGWTARAAYWRQNGHRFDSKNLERVMRFHLRDVTFLEAYRLTGRVLNITVSTGNPSDNVLNYITAPNVLLWSAVVASCALPYTYRAGTIFEKDPITGKIKAFMEGVQCLDGSIEGDIPLDALQDQFNVNHAVVAQVNPHVVPFLEDKSAVERRRKPAYVLLLDLLRKEAANWIPVMSFIPLEARTRSHLQSIVAQKYSGHITILPKDSTEDIFKVLKNPTPQYMEAAKRKGERATWERLGIIDNHMKIEKALAAASHAAREALYNAV